MDERVVNTLSYETPPPRLSRPKVIVFSSIAVIGGTVIGILLFSIFVLVLLILSR